MAPRPSAKAQSGVLAGGGCGPEQVSWQVGALASPPHSHLQELASRPLYMALERTCREVWPPRPQD